MEGKIHKFVINLKRRDDRLTKFKENCPFDDVDVEIVYGFDAQNPDLESEAEQKIFNSFHSLLVGERGVFISHMRIFQEILDKNYDYGFIMEDDALFCDNFMEKYNALIKDMPLDTNILYIGGRFKPNFEMKPENCIKISDTIVQHKKINGKWPGGADNDRTTQAYIISKLGARLLLHFFNLNRENIDLKPVDHWALQVFYENYINIYNSSPLLCYSPRHSESDIRNNMFVLIDKVNTPAEVKPAIPSVKKLSTMVSKSTIASQYRSKGIRFSTESAQSAKAAEAAQSAKAAEAAQVALSKQTTNPSSSIQIPGKHPALMESRESRISAIKQLLKSNENSKFKNN